MYKVTCSIHAYDTEYDMVKGTAVTAARMHSLLPCDSVRVLDQDNKEIDWKAEQIGFPLKDLKGE